MSIKLNWFIRRVTLGLIACWTTLMAFSRAVGAYWALLMYCIACTMMQGIFCLGEQRRYHKRYLDYFNCGTHKGLIWRMDPYAMPRSFCIGSFPVKLAAPVALMYSAQTIVIASAAYVMAAIACTVSAAISLTVLRPKEWTYSGRAWVFALSAQNANSKFLDQFVEMASNVYFTRHSFSDGSYSRTHCADLQI